MRNKLGYLFVIAIWAFGLFGFFAMLALIFSKPWSLGITFGFAGISLLSLAIAATIEILGKD